jgi:hypothetical protein
MSSRKILYQIFHSVKKNNIGPNGADALADGIRRNEGLEDVRVEDGNKIGPRGAKSFADMLKKNPRIKKFT